MHATSLLKTGTVLYGSKIVVGVVGISFLHAAMYSNTAKCAGKGKSKGKRKRKRAKVDRASIYRDAQGWDHMIGPILQQVTIGSVLGFASGYCLKKVGKVAAIAVGALFILTQGLQYGGYVDVDWNFIQHEVELTLDQDGDEDFDKDDFILMCKTILKVLRYNLPSASGFTPAFVIGLTYG